MISCADHCLHSEISASNLIIKNIQKELDEIIKNPEAWLEDLLEERQNPFSELLSINSNQENLDQKITRTLNPKDPNLFRESLLPLAALVYYTKNPKNDLKKLQNLLSFENAKKLIKNKNITNKFLEKIALKYISQKTSLNPIALKCILNECEQSLSTEDLEDCLDQCVEPTLPAHKKKEAIREQLGSIIQRIEKEELSLLDDENIKSIENLMNSNSFLFMDFPVHLIRNQDLINKLQPDLINKLLKLSKKEWDSKSIEEKLALLIRFGYPKIYRTLQLMSQENAKKAVKTYQIWNQIACRFFNVED